MKKLIKCYDNLRITKYSVIKRKSIKIFKKNIFLNKYLLNGYRITCYYKYALNSNIFMMQLALYFYDIFYRVKI